jgi:hypothetical protein
MKLAIMQPYVFPYLGYFQLLHAVDQLLIADDVCYIKGGWINRNRLLINGEAAYFTIPVERPSSSTLIADVRVDHSGRGWRRPLLKTIENYYRRAPFFSTFFPVVEDVLSADVDRIGALATRSLERVAAYLDVHTRLLPASVRAGNRHLAGQERVIDTCVLLNASEYVNAVGGQELYDHAAFAARGVQLRFVHPRLESYEQFGGGFVPGLSIIDVLMFNSPAEARKLVAQYSIV